MSSRVLSDLTVASFGAYRLASATIALRSSRSARPPPNSPDSPAPSRAPDLAKHRTRPVTESPPAPNPSERRTVAATEFGDATVKSRRVEPTSTTALAEQQVHNRRSSPGTRPRDVDVEDGLGDGTAVAAPSVEAPFIASATPQEQKSQSLVKDSQTSAASDSPVDPLAAPSDADPALAQYTASHEEATTPTLNEPGEHDSPRPAVRRATADRARVSG